MSTSLLSVCLITAIFKHLLSSVPVRAITMVFHFPKFWTNDINSNLLCSSWPIDMFTTSKFYELCKSLDSDGALEAIYSNLLYLSIYIYLFAFFFCHVHVYSCQIFFLYFFSFGKNSPSEGIKESWKRNEFIHQQINGSYTRMCDLFWETPVENEI